MKNQLPDWVQDIQNPQQKSIKQIKQEWFNENAPVGKALGYPDCCIREFCALPPELMKGKPTAVVQMRVKAAYLNGEWSGFVPCTDHARQILRGEITLHSLINNNRDKSLPSFPDALK